MKEMGEKYRGCYDCGRWRAHSGERTLTSTRGVGEKREEEEEMAVIKGGGEEDESKPGSNQR